MIISLKQENFKSYEKKSKQKCLGMNEFWLKECLIKKNDLIKWREGVILEMKIHNAILEQIGDSIPVKKEDVKNYYDCIFHRYDTCDSTIYKRVK